jgi:hypothetical protein
MHILNVHERRLAAAPDAVGGLLGTLASRDDRLWPGVPAGRWPPMRLDGPLAAGSRGGHSKIRYHVASYVPGQSLRFEFDDEGMTRGLRGEHRFDAPSCGSPGAWLVPRGGAPGCDSCTPCSGAGRDDGTLRLARPSELR